MPDDLLTDYRLLMADVYELAGLSRRTSDELAAEHGQSVARWHVLSVLSGEPHTVAATARRLGLARQSVQRVMNDLRADGAVVAEPDPRDRRAPVFTLTSEGARLAADLFAASEALRRRQLEALSISSAELRAAKAVVERLVAALGGEP